jgi:hypothetical protein
MILTLCTACAAPLPDEPDDAVQCAACATRYCSDRCERYDRRRGGHGKLCGAIASGGGAEQYHADKKYEVAVAEAVEECADDTEGQTCFICMDGDAEEGLVRGCSCRGASGFVHVSCLARQAQVLVAEAEERNLDNDAFNARWRRWDECRLCEQDYHGVVLCALGWACWKTYLGRPEADEVRSMAMGLLGSGLSEARHHEDALSVKEAELSTLRRLGASQHNILAVQSNLANTYHVLGRLEEALRLKRDVYSGYLRLNGEEHPKTLITANNFANNLIELERFEEARALVLKTMPVARRVLGDGHDLTLKLRWAYAEVLYNDDGATLADLREAVTTLEDLERIARRVFGGTHPLTTGIEEALGESRAALRARETPSPSPSESS